MAKKISIGANIALDGEKEYRQAITNINSDMRVMTSEMKLSSSATVGNSNSIEALTTRDKLLNEQIDKQKEKVEVLRLALKNSAETYGENDVKTNNWKVSLNEAETKLNNLNGTLDKNDKYLKEAKTSTDKTATSIDEYGKEVKKAEDKTLNFGDVLKANLTSEAIISGVKGHCKRYKERRRCGG